MRLQTSGHGPYHSTARSLQDALLHVAQKLGVSADCIGEVSLDDLRSGIASAIAEQERAYPLPIGRLVSLWDSLTITRFDAFVAAYLLDGASYGMTANGLMRWYAESQQ